MKQPTTEFLDENQYTRQSVANYEVVFGRGFVSPGGRDAARRLIALLGLRAGQRVLDVGCGLGGSALVMAREHGVDVHGIDLSANMIALATERIAQAEEQLAGGPVHGSIALEQADCMALDSEDAYDAIYSRDVFLHIHDKVELFAVLERALRPGGSLLFTDYCWKAGDKSESFLAYVRDRGYGLRTVIELRDQLQAAEFVDVQAEDRGCPVRC